MNVKVYGTGTSGHQMVYSTLKRYLTKAQIQFELEEISDVDEFLRLKIESIPAIIVENSVIYTIKPNEGFNFSLRKAVFQILKEKRFGRLTKVLIPIDFSEASLNSFYYCQRLLTGKMALIKLINTEHPNDRMDANKFKDTQKARQAKLHNFGLSLSKDWSNELLDGPLIDTDYVECITQKDTISNAIGNDTNLIIINSLESVEHLQISKCPILMIPSKARFKGITKVLFYSDHAISRINELIELYNLILQPNSIIYVLAPDILGDQIKTELSKNAICEIVYIQEVFEPNKVLDRIQQLNSSYAFDLISYSQSNDAITSEISKNKRASIWKEIPILLI